jgi:hypothetical protein
MFNNFRIRGEWFELTELIENFINEYIIDSDNLPNDKTFFRKKEKVNVIFRVWNNPEYYATKELQEFDEDTLIELFPEKALDIYSNDDECKGFMFETEISSFNLDFTLDNSRVAYTYEYKNMLQILQKNLFCDFIPIKVVTKEMNEKRLFDLHHNRTVSIRWELTPFPV